MQSFVDKSKEDLDAAKEAWSTFQSSSQTAFTAAQDKRASDFNSQRSGFETGFSEQKTDFENRFKALLATLQNDYDDFKALINKDVTDFNTSLDSLDSQATDVKNKYAALKAQLDLAAQNISGVRTNLLLGTSGTLQTVTNASGWNTNLPIYRPNIKEINSDTTYTVSAWISPVSYDMNVQIFYDNAHYGGGSRISAGTSGYSTWTGTLPAGSSINFVAIVFSESQSTASSVSYCEAKLEKGPTATDWCPNPLEIATDGSVQTAITNALDKADYSTTAEVDSKISTGVGQAKTYAEQTIKGIIGAAPTTLDTIAELADAVTKNKDGVQAINEGITKKADKTELANYESKAEVISQTDYEAKKTAGTLEDKFYIVTDDTEAS